MFERFFPDEYLDSAYVIDYEKLYREGFRGVLFDIDNTLVPHGAPADERAIRLFHHLQELGFSCCLVSNNKKKRVEPFAAAVGASYLSMAAKPAKGATEGQWSFWEQTYPIPFLWATSFLRTSAVQKRRVCTIFL